MRIWTYEEIEDKVRLDLDLQDTDNFVTNDEMAGYCNEAIDDAEAEILKLNEDYFLTSALLTMTQGSAAVSLPSDIYAQKLRSIIYESGSKIYPLRRIRDPNKFYRKAEIDHYGTSETEYTYILKAGTAGAQSNIQLSPVAQETSSTVLTAWYIRNANRVPIVGYDGGSRATQLATNIDIPEWAPFLIQWMKWRCYEKELDPRHVKAEQALVGLRKSMVEALQERVPDNDDKIPPDVDIYEEHN